MIDFVYVTPLARQLQNIFYFCKAEYFMFQILELNKIKAQGMQNLQLCQFPRFFN